GPNEAEWVAWSHAAWMCGATTVPMPVPVRIRSRSAVEAHLNAFASGFECSTIAAHERFASLFADQLTISWGDAGSPSDALSPDELVRLNDDTLAIVAPTSGSTAAPRGVGRTYARHDTTALRMWVNPFNVPQVRYLTYAPLAHVAGSCGATAVLEPTLEIHMLSPQRFARDPAELLRLVARHRISATSATS